MSEELKPCPACGSLQLIKRGFGVEPHTNRLPHIECYACGMGGPHCSTIEEAVAAWNALPRALEWTNEPPKVPGWYFYRDAQHGNTVYFVTPNMATQLDVNKFPHNPMWSGPIPEPR